MTKELFKHLHKDGKYIVRDDVWINFLNRRGKLTVGFGSPGRIGPELEFGNAVGDHFEEQVLIIKTAWGGKSLGRDFLPPSSGLPIDAIRNDPEALACRTLHLERNKKRKRPEITLDDVKAGYGKCYRDMMTEVDTCLKELKTRFPDYEGQGYEIAGFVWFQGWNDMFNPDFVANYAKHMANFIRDVRKDLKAPKLPFVIGVMGHNGPKPATGNLAKIKEAQASMGSIPEFKGNVAIVQTDQYWDMEADAVYKKGWSKHLEEWKKVGSDRPYHYLGSAKFFTRVGKAFGKATIALCEKQK
ncbi:sialate O-acetylesterase [Planctomycetota bacterium]